MLKVNAFDESTCSDLNQEELKLISRRQQVMGPAYQLFYNHPLHLVKGEGTYVFDKNGNKYLDMYNNVPSMGHSHPKIVEALTNQASQLCTHTRYLHEGIIEYSERLLNTMPNELKNIMFTCTGSEANDLALRIAKDFTGGTGVIVTEYAYHGITESIAALSPAMGEYVPLSKDVRTIPPPFLDSDSPDLIVQKMVKHVNDAIIDMKRHGIKLAAIMIDSLITSDGVFPDPIGFFKPIIELIHEAGGVFIADEVQSGFGRTGSHMWGFSRHGITPDIVTMGKPMGNGYPLAGMAIKPHILQRFAREASYFNTFGGNPVAAAVGMAVLDILEQEELMKNSLNVGAQLKKDLIALSKNHPILNQIRGEGLFIGIDIIDSINPNNNATMARKIVNDLRDRGFLIGVSGKNSNILKIRPPLCINNQDTMNFIESLEHILKKMQM